MKKNKLLNFIYRSKLFRVNHFLIENKYDQEQYKLTEVIDDLRFINYYNVSQLNEAIKKGDYYDN